jgi:hypothetical protein
VRLPSVTNIAYTPQSPFEIAETSTTSYDFTNVFHAFAAAPVTQATVVDVAGGTVVVVGADDDEEVQAPRTSGTTRATREMRFMMKSKLGDIEVPLREFRSEN